MSCVRHVRARGVRGLVGQGARDAREHIQSWAKDCGQIHKIKPNRFL